MQAVQRILRTGTIILNCEGATDKTPVTILRIGSPPPHAAPG